MLKEEPKTERQSIGSALIDAMSAAIVLLDSCGRVTWYNRHAANIIRRSQAFVSGANGIRGSLLLPRDAATAMRLALLMQQLLRAPDLQPAVLVVPAPSGQNALLASLFILTGPQGGPSIVLCLADPLQPLKLPQPEMLRQLWGLTAAEARIAIAVVECEGLTAAARALGITTNTAKAHLSNVFEKTGAHSQTRLVRLLMSVAAASRPL